MAYTDDAVKAKLSALNETQESIVTVAQWIMFHRRHADRTASLLLQRLKDSGANKRLNLIYLANEVAQQSKARQKTDFIDAFEPVSFPYQDDHPRRRSNLVTRLLPKRRQLHTEVLQMKSSKRYDAWSRYGANDRSSKPPSKNWSRPE